MKKILTLLIALFVVISLTGCTTDSPIEPEEKEVTMKVGFALPTLQSEFFVWYSDGIKAALEAEGYEVSITSYDGDASKLISTIETFTVSNVDAIIAMVMDASSEDALKAAMEAGIKVVVPGVVTENYDLALVADNADVGKQIGEMAAEFVNSQLSGEAEVIAFVSSANPDMASRSNGMLEAFKAKAPKATIVTEANYVQVGDATNAMENALQQNPNIKVIISFGDQGAVEAVNVLKAAGKVGDDYAAFGCDLTQEGLKLIKAGDIFRGTVDMGNIVTDTANLTLQLLKGELSPLPYKYVGVNKKVTIENVSDYLK